MCGLSLLESLLIFPVLPHVDWALWLCCLQGQGGEKEKHSCPLPSRPGVTDRHGADGAAIGGARSHTRIHTHTRVHPCIHAHTYIHTLYRGEEQGLCQSHTYAHSCCCSVCRPFSACTCVLVCSGLAHCIYHVLSRDCMLMYHRKDSLWARTLNDILSGRDECDLHMQVEQIKKDWLGPWHFHQGAVMWLRKKKKKKPFTWKPQPGGAIPNW